MRVKLVDAFWEQRNLGVSCVEVAVDSQDSVPEILSAVDDVAAQYEVIRVPSGRVDIVAGLEGQGFGFIEAAFSVEHDLRLPELSGVLARLVNGVSYEPITDQFDAVAVQIHSGMFQSDRIYLDPHFTSDQAASRYVHWMRDETARGATVYEMRRGASGVGFFLFRSAGDVGLSALSGLYRSASFPGLGAALLYLTLAEGARRELKVLKSTVSSNNLAVVKTHCLLGFQIVGINYLMVRHRRSDTHAGK